MSFSLVSIPLWLRIEHAREKNILKCSPLSLQSGIYIYIFRHRYIYIYSIFWYIYIYIHNIHIFSRKWRFTVCWSSHIFFVFTKMMTDGLIYTHLERICPIFGGPPRDHYLADFGTACQESWTLSAWPWQMNRKAWSVSSHAMDVLFMASSLASSVCTLYVSLLIPKLQEYFGHFDWIFFSYLGRQNKPPPRPLVEVENRHCFFCLFGHVVYMGFF